MVLAVVFGEATATTLKLQLRVCGDLGDFFFEFINSM
jgi:hypothetical protein